MTAGRSIAGYRLLEPIGRGAQAEVWLAADRHDPRLRRVVKVAASAEGTARSRFLHEARLGRTVAHPNVVRVLDAGEADGALYLVMAHVDGPSWRGIIQSHVLRGEPVPVTAAVQMTVDALRGLQALHDAVDEAGVRVGFVHRDLAPKNLMVDRSGRSIVIDLGIARSNLRDERTATGIIIGTPGYMSPEQVRSARVDGRSDVFAMGAVLFELLTLERFIRGRNVIALLSATEADAYRPVTAVRSDVSPEIEAAVRRAVRLDPPARFASPGAFADALDDTLSQDGRTAVTAVAAPLPAGVPVVLDAAEPTAATAAAHPPRPLGAPPGEGRAAPTAALRWRLGALFLALVGVSAWLTERYLAHPSAPTVVTPRAAAPSRPVVTPQASPPKPQPPPSDPPPPAPAPSGSGSAPPPPPNPRAARVPITADAGSATGPSEDPPEALPQLIERARRIARAAPTPGAADAALDLVFRLNRLSAEAQRGRAVDLTALRQALERLETQVYGADSKIGSSLPE